MSDLRTEPANMESDGDEPADEGIIGSDDVSASRDSQRIDIESAHELPEP